MKLFNFIPAIVFAFFISAGTVLADWNINDGYKMHGPQLPNEQGFIVKGFILADDWQCSDSGWIKDLHFWGAWKAGNEGVISEFIIIIWADIPANPPDTLCGKPGEELWYAFIDSFIVSDSIISPGNMFWFDPSTNMSFLEDSVTYYQYNIFLNEYDWFWQEEGTIYWLTVIALVFEPETYEWGWISTSNNWNNNAVWIDPDLMWYHMNEPPGYPSYIPGDVDGSCVVDSNDVNHLQNYIMGGPPPRLAIPDNGGIFYPAADANGSCTINSIDVTYLVFYLDHGGPAPLYCYTYPPEGSGSSLDLAFVVNDGPPEPIPTLSEWGMLIMALLLLAVGTVAVVRRRAVVKA